jgi:hypothetical protein
MNNQEGYIICVHRVASTIFGADSKPLNLYGAFLFFEDSARARSECDLLNARSFSDIHYSVEPALNLTTPILSPWRAEASCLPLDALRAQSVWACTT